MHDWMEQAACKGCGPELFFNELGDSQTFRDTLYVCNGGTRTHKDGRTYTTETKPPCPVKQQCLDYAMSFPTDQDQYGIFGGCTPNQRDLIRRERRRIEREPQVEQDCARDQTQQDCALAPPAPAECSPAPADLAQPATHPDDEPLTVLTIRGSVDEWRANLGNLLTELNSLLLPAKPTPHTSTLISS
jgi:hypothetical protein